ncbi:MAG: 1-acyl-sn-glycerol-3-phosphate acyltransferase [bacterium]
MLRLTRSILRHLVGYGVVFPLILLGIALQALIAGPLFGNRRTIPNLIFRACALVFAVRFTLSPTSAPFAAGPTLFLSNHLSRLDFAGLPLFHDAAVMMNAMFFRMPVLGPIIRLFAHSAGIIATEQRQHGKARDQQQLAEAMDHGRNLFIFAEGIQTDGLRLLRYSPGAAEIFYDPALRARFPALQTARLQPVVLRVKTIEGVGVLHDPAKWGRYSLSRGRSSIFSGMSRLSLTGSITLEFLILPALDPRDFASAADLVNEAHAQTRAIIAPDQTRTMTRAQWKSRLDARDFTL